LKIRDLSKF